MSNIDWMKYLLDYGLAGFIAIAMLYIAWKSVPIFAQIKMLMIQLLEVLKNKDDLIKNNTEAFHDVKEIMTRIESKL